MAEENQEKKKPRLVKRIFKLISLALLTLLLILALFFQAPWKVIMANHLYQQPMLAHHLVGLAMESKSLLLLNRN